MNKVIISGNLCRDIELRVTSTGKDVTSNCVAVQRERKETDGTYASDFINIVVWGQQATYLNTYASKGSRVEIVGRIQTRNYEDQNGETKTATEVVVESIKAFKKGEATAASVSEEEPDEIEEEDLPF